MTCCVQDLKDHFRSAGDVVFTDSYNDGTGIVEFSRYEDFKRALRDMDDSKFRSHEVSDVSCCGCVCSYSSLTGRDSIHSCQGSKGFTQSLTIPAVQVPLSISFQVEVLLIVA